MVMELGQKVVLTICWLPVAGCRLPVAGCRLPVASGSGYFSQWHGIRQRVTRDFRWDGTPATRTKRKCNGDCT